MTLLRTLCGVALLAGSAHVLADASSHAAEAERFLQLTRADKMTVPVYAQVQQAFNQRFAEHPNKGKEALLERYQAKANASLDKVVGWDKLKPEMVQLYTRSFTEQELKDLNAFYQSPLGRKMMDKLPALTMDAAQLTQKRLMQAAPEVNKLLTELSAELAPAKP
jgi:hypothetical protein